MAQGEVDYEDDQGNVVLGQWRQDVRLTDGHNMVGNRLTKEAKRQCHYLADYYNSPFGKLPWQDRVVSVED